MINALVVLALMAQDADPTVTGHGRRHGSEYDLTITGKGKALRDGEVVSLKFRRLVNRYGWEDGALTTAPVEEEIARTVTAAGHQLVHVEKFTTPAEIDVRVGWSQPDGASKEQRFVFRTAAPLEEARALGSAATTFDGALRGARMMLDDIEAIHDEMCPVARKQAQLRKRIDWRKAAYRKEIADSFLSASSHALTQWMADVEAALDLERAGKEPTSMLSSLTGKPFGWDEARSHLEVIESLSVRERALLAVRVASAVLEALPGATKDLRRAIEVLQEQRQVRLSGPSAESVEHLLSQIHEVLNGSDGAPVAEAIRPLAEQVTTIEETLRSGH